MQPAVYHIIANYGYSQSLEKGTVTFRTECPTYEDWDSVHIKECRYVYEMDGKVVGYTMIAPTSQRDSYSGVVELREFYNLGGLTIIIYFLYKFCGVFAV